MSVQTIICPYLTQQKPTSFPTVCLYHFFCVCFQLEEIKNIGSLPCLEKLNLSSNPMCIIPDYRTKVLAQFGDRAAEVHRQNQCTVNVKALLPLMPLRRGTVPTVPNTLRFCNKLLLVLLILYSGSCCYQLLTLCIIRFVLTAS